METKYYIASGRSLKEIIESVNTEISENGFVPIGGISVVYDKDNRKYFYQALIRQTETKK